MAPVEPDPFTSLLIVSVRRLPAVSEVSAVYPKHYLIEGAASAVNGALLS